MKNNRCPIVLKPFLVLMISLLLCAAVSYDMKREGLSIWNYIIVFTIVELTLITLMVNHTFAAKILRIFTGHFNLETTVFYLLYALLPCTGGLAGLGLGYGIWKIINKL